MAKKKTTIEDLARMVATGFNSVESKMATKADMDRQFKDLNVRLSSLEKDMEYVKNLITLNHKRRIEKVELEMKELKNALAM